MWTGPIIGPGGGPAGGPDDGPMGTMLGGVGMFEHSLGPALTGADPVVDILGAIDV